MYLFYTNMRNLLFLISLLVCSCHHSTRLPPVVAIPVVKGDQPSFTLDKDKYEAALPSETKIKINIAEQKARLLNAQGEVILESDVSTGKEGRPTPRGTFEVLERIVDKRSNKYGQYVDKDTREVIVLKAWEHKGPKPANTEYQGIAMPYWMRLTWYGVGMHEGGFKKGVPSSFGCIRVLEASQPYFYYKTKLGTKVMIE